jgi:hypothetical protein
VCGHHRFMKRFRDDRPADICLRAGRSIPIPTSWRR